MKQKRCWIMWMTLLFYGMSNNLLDAKKIGSDSEVTLFHNQQIAGNGDAIAAFAALGGGFVLGNKRVCTTFGSFYPVCSDVQLNGGLLSLETDLVLQGNGQIESLGSIHGNNHALVLSSRTAMLSNGAATAQAYLVATKTAPVAINACHWSSDATHIAVAQSNAARGSIGIYEFDGADITQKDSLSLATVAHAVQWHPQKNYIIVGKQGSITTSALELYYYDNAAGKTTAVSAVPYAKTGDVVAVSWHPSGNWLAAIQGKNARQLALYEVSQNGIISKDPAALITLSRSLQSKALSWDASGNYIAVGVARDNNNPDLIVYSFNEDTKPTLVVDSALCIGETVCSLDWNRSQQDILAIGLSGKSGQEIRIIKHKAGCLEQKTVVAGLGSPIRALSWSPNGYSLAVAAGKTFGEVRTYYYDADTQFLQQYSCYRYSNPINDISFDTTNQSIVCGTDSVPGSRVNNADLMVYRSDAYRFNNEQKNVFQDVTLVLNADLVLQDCSIVFKGNCTLVGNGFSLILGPSASILVDEESVLSCNNLVFSNLQQNNIRCIGDSSHIRLQNVSMLLADDYTFDKGSLSVVRDVEIVGSGCRYTYSSDQPMIVRAHAQLALEKGVVLRFEPRAQQADTLIFESDSSALRMHGATLSVNHHGLVLKRGSLVLTADSYLQSEAQEESFGAVAHGGITLGADDAAHDCACLLVQSANLHITEGSSLHYRNMLDQSWGMHDVGSQLILHTDATLYVHQSLHLDNGTLRNTGPATIAKVVGKNLIGKVVNTLGQLLFSTIPAKRIAI